MIMQGKIPLSVTRSLLVVFVALAIVGSGLAPGMAQVADKEVRISWAQDSSANSRPDCPPGEICRNLRYELSGFGPGPYQLECWSPRGMEWSGPWSGRAHAGCYFWDKATAWVVIDGVKSNVLRWTTKHAVLDVDNLLSVGFDHSCGLRIDGTIDCWGSNKYGQVDPPLAQFTAVSVNAVHSCGLRVDGTIDCWGNDGMGETRVPIGTFTAVSAGHFFSCGLRVDGTVDCWGLNWHGEADAPDGVFTELSAGQGYSCGLRVDGTVDCWGSDTEAVDVPGGVFTALSVGNVYFSCGLRVNRTVECWGSNSEPDDVPDGSFIALSTAPYHSCGLRVNGTVECWGLGSDWWQVDGPGGVFGALSVSESHSCGLRLDGTAICWGSNDHGQAHSPEGGFTLPSGPVGTDLPVGVPSEPSNLHIYLDMEKSRGGQVPIIAEWSPPEDEGTSPITGYTLAIFGGVYTGTGMDTFRFRATDRSSGSRLPNATFGSTYRVEVSAKNKQGKGPSVSAAINLEVETLLAKMQVTASDAMQEARYAAKNNVAVLNQGLGENVSNARVSSRIAVGTRLLSDELLAIRSSIYRVLVESVLEHTAPSESHYESIVRNLPRTVAPGLVDYVERTLVSADLAVGLGEAAATSAEWSRYTACALCTVKGRDAVSNIASQVEVLVEILGIAANPSSLIVKGFAALTGLDADRIQLVTNWITNPIGTAAELGTYKLIRKHAPEEVIILMEAFHFNVPEFPNLLARIIKQCYFEDGREKYRCGHRGWSPIYICTPVD